MSKDVGTFRISHCASRGLALPRPGPAGPALGLGLLLGELHVYGWLDNTKAKLFLGGPDLLWHEHSTQH